MVNRRTPFREYQNKNSVSKKKSRYNQGGQTTIFEDRLGWWEREVFDRDPATDLFVTLPKSMEGKPSLISKAFYGRDDLAWIVLQYNDIVDLDELKAGVQITIPSRERVFNSILTKPAKNVKVKKFKPNTGNR